HRQRHAPPSPRSRAAYSRHLLKFLPEAVYLIVPGPCQALAAGRPALLLGRCEADADCVAFARDRSRRGLLAYGVAGPLNLYEKPPLGQKRRRVANGASPQIGNLHLFAPMGVGLVQRQDDPGAGLDT